MKRLIAAAFATALSATALVTMAAPASAHTSVCVGTGTATTGNLGYPVTLPGPTVTVPAPTVGFNLKIGPGFGVGGCVGVSPTGPTLLTASGNLTGYCGHSTGSGTLTDGNHAVAFAYVSAGSLLVVTAGVTFQTGTNTELGTTVRVYVGGGAGVANAVPVPGVSGTTVTNSCASRTASQFQVTGAVVLTGL